MLWKCRKCMTHSEWYVVNVVPDDREAETQPQRSVLQRRTIDLVEQETS